METKITETPTGMRIKAENIIFEDLVEDEGILQPKNNILLDMFNSLTEEQKNDFVLAILNQEVILDGSKCRIPLYAQNE